MCHDLTQLHPIFAAKLIIEQYMSLQEEINSIINDKQLTYDEKCKKLQKYLTLHEVRALLLEPREDVKLKIPLVPKTKEYYS